MSTNVMSMSDLVALYGTAVDHNKLILKLMEECGEVQRAASKFLAMDNFAGEAEAMEAAYQHMMDEVLDVYIVVSWLIAQMGEASSQQRIGQLLYQTMVKLGLTEKLNMEHGTMRVNHGFPVQLVIIDVAPTVPEEGTVH